MNARKLILGPLWNLANSESGTDSGRTKKLIFAIVGIVGASAVFLVTRSGGPPANAVGPMSAVGQIAAEETAKLLGSGGRVVVVHNPTLYVASPLLRGQFDAFEATIKRQRGITVTATEAVQGKDLSSAGGLTASKYTDLVEKYPDAEVIVSFVGPPILNGSQIKSLPQKHPSFVAVSLSGAPLKRLFEENVIQVAIINRLEPAPPSSSQPKTVRDWFDQLFLVVTASDASSLPS